MKNVKFIFGLILIGLGGGCLEQPNSTPGTSSTILYRHHFVGTANLARSTNTAKLPTVLALPATREMTDLALQNISATAQELWRKSLPASVPPQPGLIRPLLDDLLSAESYAEVHGPLHKGESVFAIELNEERAGLWRTNLANILTAWRLGKPSALSLGEAKGWELKKADAPTLIQFVRSGKWVLIGLGQERLTLLPALLEETRKNGRPVPAPANVPLEVEADLPRLGDWLPSIAQYKLPPIHLTLTGKGNYLRTELRLTFSDRIPWVYESWQIPTNTIKDPLIGFTVARGVQPLLSQVKRLPAVGLTPLPNQFCSWSPETHGMGETFLSIPITNPSNILYQIGPNLPDFFTNLLSQPVGGFTLISNRNELVWGGWPMLIPHLRTVRDGGADYLVGGLFPMRPSSNPPPAELFAQLKDRTNLVYYSWEITQERLVHTKQMQQIWDITKQRALAPSNAPSQKWLTAIAPQLVNTITEASLTSPNQLTFVRRSDIGLTALELATLARWVASSGFPWTFAPPPPLFPGSSVPSPNVPSPNVPVSRTNSPPQPPPAPNTK